MLYRSQFIYKFDFSCSFIVTFIEKKKAPEDKPYYTSSILGVICWCIWNTLIHPLPILYLSIGLAFAYLPSPIWYDFVVGFSVHYVLTCFCMSVILHRYFSHAAYKASRPVSFVLGVLGCLAYQYGPMWWSSKHRRHHKECDKNDDPHSWAKYGLGYAWLGWTMHPAEQHIDVKYVHRYFKVGESNSGPLKPELALVDRLFFLPTYLMHAFLLFGVGVPLHTVVYRYTVPSCLCSIATLWFNCKFHPPSKEMENICNSIDLLYDPLAALHGEAYHKDHHSHPRRAKRPGPDLGYFLAILPLQILGIFQTSKGVNRKHLM